MGGEGGRGVPLQHGGGGVWGVLPHEYFEIIRGKWCILLYSGSSVYYIPFLYITI